MLNIAAVEGRFKADPLFDKTKTSGKSVCSFCLAVERDVSKKAEKDTVDWINCVAWGSTAENIAKYFKKGDGIIITGRIQTRPWDDIKGNTRTATEIVVDHFNFPIKARSKQDGIDLVADDDYSGKTPSRPRSNRTARFTELPDDGDLPF